MDTTEMELIHSAHLVNLIVEIAQIVRVVIFAWIDII